MSRVAIFLYRLGTALVGLRLGLLARVVKIVNMILTSAEIDPRAKLGRNLRMPHPAGVVIGRGVVVGDDVHIGQHVTLGGNMGKREGDRSYPVVGSNVLIAAGSLVAGPIDICDGVIIGANSVATASIRAPGVYAGAPVRFIRDLNDHERGVLGLAP